MSDLLQYALLGLGPGAMFAIMGIGVVVIYRGSGVLNFAHGACGMIGAFIYYDLTKTTFTVQGDKIEPTLATWQGALVGIAVSALIGVVIHLGIMRSLRDAAPLTKVIATLGVMIALQSAALLRWGSTPVPVNSWLPSENWSLTDNISVGSDRIYLFIIAVVLSVSLVVFFRSTRFGLATSASAENPLAAEALGVSPDRVGVWNWALGGALAGLAGILISPIINLSITSLTLLVVVALAAALIGQFTSILATLAGGLAIGVAQSVLTNPDIATALPAGTVDAFPLVLIIGVLMFRGDSLPTRGFVGMRMPQLGTGEINVRLVGGLLAVGLALVWLALPDNWIEAVLTSFLISLVALSLVVVTGYTGQVSLAQWALAGFGAYTAGRLVTEGGMPFVAALPLAVIASTVVGVLVALPALRTRGVTLAVVTLSLALVLQVMVYAQTADRRIPEPTLFGWEIDALTNPRRYLTVVLVVFAAVAVMLGNIRRSRSGRRLVAVRTNERAAASLGINPFEAKLYGFAVGAAIAGLGGVFLAFRQSFLVFASFNVFGNINLVAWGVIGGVGYIIGPIWSGLFAPAGIGAEIFRFWDSVESYMPLVGGISLILILRNNPDGLAEPHVHIAHAIAEKRAAKHERPAVDPAIFLTEVSEEATSTVEPATLEVRNLSVAFGGVRALDDVSFSVHPGEVLGLIGPNGAGKTTFIDAVTGFVKPTGTITVDGEDVSRLPAHGRARRGIGRSWQSLELFEDMTVLDNLRAAAEDRTKKAYLTDLFRPSRAPLPPVASAAVKEFGLEGDLHRHPGELPYGKRRLVAIARAVAAAPSVLLLDEPAAGLDHREVEELGDLVTRLARDWGLAVLLIEHDIEMVMALSDRVVALDFGMKIAEGSPIEVSNDPGVVAAYLGVDEDEVDLADESLPDRQPEGAIHE